MDNIVITPPLTWAKVKEIVNNMTKDQLQDNVIIWTDRDDDASSFSVKDIEELEEDYLKDDEGCFPASFLEDTKELEGDDFDINDHPVVLKKGRRIIYAE